MFKHLVAGSTQVDITPSSPCFLWGYPNVERMSTGVYDSLMSSSLYLSDGRLEFLFIANDLIFVSKELCHRIRQKITEETGIPAEAILISATHTHSGPTIVNYLSNTHDPLVPEADVEYLEFLVRKVVQGACESVRCTAEAEVGQVYVNIEGVGTNREDPAGPNDCRASLLIARTRGELKPIGAMIVYGMHPTVLHQDTTLISADFPGMARYYLQENLLGWDCPVVYHNGVCGNLSPRYITRSNTIDEMMRIGFLLGRQLVLASREMEYTDCVDLAVKTRHLRLEVREFPDSGAAEANLQAARKNLDTLLKRGAPRPVIRTAECAVFGAEEALTLSKTRTSEAFKAAVDSCCPAEISLFRIGTLLYLAWPGEIFVEYSLDMKRKYPNLSVVSMANGELQGYIVTEEAFESGGYEASNALFSFRNGPLIVRLSELMIQELETESRKVVRGS